MTCLWESAKFKQFIQNFYTNMTSQKSSHFYQLSPGLGNFYSSAEPSVPISKRDKDRRDKDKRYIH